MLRDSTGRTYTAARVCAKVHAQKNTYTRDAKYSTSADILDLLFWISI